MSLAPLEHWNSLYENLEHAPRGTSNSRTRLRQTLGKVFERCKPYDDFVLWNVLYPKFVPSGHAKTALEIGSAPGEYLVRVRDRLGYEPFGVEYSGRGAAINRATFARANISTDHVFEANVFDPLFLRAHAERFDLVLSRGFIEHFADPTEVALAHWKLLKPGGTLVVSVPNLRGFNYQLTKIINSDVIAIHNLDIMSTTSIRALFENIGATSLFCDYYGVLNFDMTYARHGSRWRHLMSSLSGVQLALNASFRAVFRGNAGNSTMFSPHLVYIARKTRAL